MRHLHGPEATITQVRMISNLGMTNDAVTLVEDRDDKAALPDAQLMGTSWSDFGDLILVTRYLDQASPPFNPTQYLVVDPDVGPASVSPLVTVDEGFAWGPCGGTSISRRPRPLPAVPPAPST